jgi:prepilin-type N-terminal cleavage/methylation domain-containing protein
VRRAFTLIEIIFVIVVLSIIAGGTFSYILDVYRVYVRANSVDTMQNDLDIAMTQIANRLSYRIKDSIIYGKGANQLLGAGERNNTLEWIGYDREGLMGMWDGSKIQAGWSGFIDRSTITTSSLTTLGSNLDYANQIISSLSYSLVDLTSGGVALITPRDIEEDITSYSWYTTAPPQKNYYIVSGYSGNTLTGTDFDNITNTDRYYLSWTAYALDLNNSRDLNLYYNYRPWNGNIYTSGLRALMLKNVTLFTFWQVNSTLWFKICVDSNNTDNISESNSSNYGFCKERFVY